MPLDFEITVDNTKEILADMERKCQAALEACGNQAVTHAKQTITRAGRIDTHAMIDSVAHKVQEDTCHVGTNVEYAIYHEYGSGKYAADGNGRKTPWSYIDKKTGEKRWTSGVTPIHFIKNAVANHIQEYKAIMEKYIRN